jgi:PAS domain S-box-containing protein/putative nucleotidyltransferase with HDIG domain
MIGHLYTNFVPPDEAKRGMAELATALAGGASTWESENRVNHRDGHEVVLSANAQVQRDAAGNIVGMVGTSRDITARKLAEEALQASEARNRSLIEHLPTVVYTNAVADTSSTLYVSPQIQNLVGYTPQEWMADPKLWSKTLHPEDRENVLRRAAHTDQSKEPFEMEYRMIARDGRLVWVHDQIILVYDREGLPQFWQGIMLNITARKQAELARDHLARIVDASEDAVLSKTLDGVITSWNRGSERIYGYSARESIGRSISFIIPPDKSNELPDILDRIQHGKHIEHFETVRVRKDGKRIHISVTVSPMIDSIGNIVGASIIARDITERKLVENQLNYHARLLRHISDAVIATDDQLRITAWNRAAARMYGWASEDVMGHFISEVLSFDLTDEQRVEAREQLNESMTSHSETVHHRKDGRTLNVEVNTIALIDEQGKMTGYVSVNRDITERKQAEEALRESESSLQGILRSTADGILAVNKENKILFANERFMAMWHIPQAVVASQNDSVLIQYVLDQLNDPQTFLRKIQEVYRSEEESFDTLDFKDGRVFERISHPLLQKTELRGRVWSFRDVTYRNQAEEALRASQERLSQVWEVTSDAMGLSDPEGIMLAANPAYLELYGYTREQVIGKSFAAIFPEEFREQAVEQYKQVFGGEAIAPGFESAIQRSDGTERIVEANATFLTTNGLRTAMLSTIRDISLRKQAEVKIQRQLEHLTALSSIDRVIAGNVDLKLSLSQILTHVTTELGIDAAAILMFNSSSQILEYGAERGFRAQAIRKVPVRLGGSYAGRVVLNRQFIQIPNLGGEPENLFLGTPLADEGFVFYCALPLIAKGQVLGVLEVFHRAVLEPDAEWLDFLYALAGQAAIAIENATLFERLQRSNSELTLAYDATIEGWSRALDLRDKETEGHSLRVTEMTVRLARDLGLSEAELMQVRWGALLHDIGKMGVPDGILLKPGSLTDEEWVAMKKHPVFAYEMLSPIRHLRMALDIPYCHHEKWDGTGYPRGLKGEQIPLAARIFAVVDVWDALSSDRPYRAGWKEEKVRLHILALSGTHFDPQVVDRFMQMPK